PTIAEAGIPGLGQFEAIAWNGLVAPVGTPPEIIIRLNREINAVLKLPALKRKLFDAGIAPGGGSPEAFAALIKAEAKKWGEVIRTTGAKVD
ncbi:MAG: tripartite tricarboxylate transporter substrate-binding protein, partial [Betaproteobacteria bacterium]